MSLSAVLADMEAEGRETVSPCLLISSSSSSDATLTRVLASLLGCDDEDCDGVRTGAIGSEIGLAIALPSSPYEALVTVEACAGAIVYVMEQEQGSGNVDTSLLAPAVEKALSCSSYDEKKMPLVVLVANDGSLEKAEKSFYAAMSEVWSSIIKNNISELDDVFDISFVSMSDDGAKKCLQLIEEYGECDPSTAAAAVASSVANSSVDLMSSIIESSPLSTSLKPVELAAATKLGRVAKSALESTVVPLTEIMESDRYVPDFGVRVDVALKMAAEEFDNTCEGSGSSLVNSSVGKRKKKDMLDEAIADLELVYEQQLVQLRLACFEKFRQSLSSLRISPNLPDDMNAKVTESVKDFGVAVKKLKPSTSLVATNSWVVSAAAAKSDYRNLLKEFCTDRLKAARLSGAFKDPPRKAISVGLHWLIPKPFGTDSQQTPSGGRFDPSNIVYTPPTKRVDISASDIMEGTGSWKGQVTPSIAGSAMVYKSEDPQANE